MSSGQAALRKATGTDRPEARDLLMLFGCNCQKP